MPRRSTPSPRTRWPARPGRSSVSTGWFGRWSKPSKTSLTAWLGVWLAAATAACGGPNGEGIVTGSFFVRECTFGGGEEFPEYSYDPARFATVRFEDILQIIVQQDSVDFVEGDALLIRVDGLEALRKSSIRPIVLPVSRSRAHVNAALSLFETCPRRPTLTAVSGTLRLDRFTIAEDPRDAGSQEVIQGTLTATVVSADPNEIVGKIFSSFDFEPPAREPNDVVFP